MFYFALSLPDLCWLISFYTSLSLSDLQKLCHFLPLQTGIGDFDLCLYKCYKPLGFVVLQTRTVFYCVSVCWSSCKVCCVYGWFSPCRAISLLSPLILLAGTDEQSPDSPIHRSDFCTCLTSSQTRNAWYDVLFVRLALCRCSQTAESRQRGEEPRSRYASPELRTVPPGAQESPDYEHRSASFCKPDFFLQSSILIYSLFTLTMEYVDC